MIDWLKRLFGVLFGPRVGGHAEDISSWHITEPVYLHDAARPVQNADIVANAAHEATIAQKNVRLASIARTRDAVKREIARLKRNKKKHSHMMAELARLTRLELELESGK